MDGQQLEALVDEGLSIREIGERVGRSPTSVRHWLRRYELATHEATRRRGRQSPGSDAAVEIEMWCPKHGVTAHRARADSGYACRPCRSEAVARRRRRIKKQLVAEAGGTCALCGYSRSPAALVFHHLDPAQKSFGLAVRGYTRSLAPAREEARKCLLLCANCHAKVEAGDTILATSHVRNGPG